MSFFDSEVVRAEMTEISELQEDVYTNVFKFPTMNKEEKLFHVGLLGKLIEKQKILYTRLSLSDDPDAKQLVEQVKNAASMLGMPPEDVGPQFYDTLKENVQNMMDQLPEEN